MKRQGLNMEYPFNNIENSDLPIRFISGETTPEESKLLEQWLNHSPENKKYFDEILRVFNNQLSDQESSEFDTDQAWHTINKSNTAEVPMLNKKRSLLVQITRVAAFFILLVGIAGVYFLINPKKVILESQVYVVDFQLPDGSSTTLNKNSTLEYTLGDFGKQKREVTLKGEAFFDVKTNPLLPFIIYTDNIEIEVVGTSFNVCSYPNDDIVEVTVKTGKVKVKHRDEEILLSADEKARYTKTTKLIAQHLNKDPNYLGWKTKKYIFEDSPIEQVLKTIEKDFDVHFILNNKEFRQCRLFSHFDNNKLDDILTILKHTFNIEYSIQGNQIFIEGKGCN